MRYNRRNDPLRVQMFSDLSEAYSRVCANCWTQTEAERRTVLSPAPRFYIRPEAAYRVLSTMLTGDFESIYAHLKPLRRQMYDDLYDVVMRLSRKRDYQGFSLMAILPYALRCPARRFYIHSRTFARMVTNHRLRGGYNRDAILEGENGQRYHQWWLHRNELRKHPATPSSL